MAADTEQPGVAPPEPVLPAPPRERMFLVVVDKTEEMRNALRFACRRAQHTDGRVGLLYYIEPADFQHWMGVEAKMREEKREEAEQILQKLASEVQSMSGDDAGPVRARGLGARHDPRGHPRGAAHRRAGARRGHLARAGRARWSRSWRASCRAGFRSQSRSCPVISQKSKSTR